MPRAFYPDTMNNAAGQFDDAICGNEVAFFDGPAVCTRPKGHKVDTNMPAGPFVPNVTPDGEFHQEEYEGWIWDDKGHLG